MDCGEKCANVENDHVVGVTCSKWSPLADILWLWGCVKWTEGQIIMVQFGSSSLYFLLFIWDLFSFFFFFVVLGIEPRALHMLGKQSTTKPHSLTPSTII